MSSSPLAAGIQQLRGRLACHDRPAQSDEQLLNAFQNQHDDGAFAVLVRRHGPMVLRVCRRVLGQEQDAEDAFQATFLVLARNVASLRNPAILASFLHGTAYRTALKARQSAARRRKHEGRAATRSSNDPAEQLSWREVQTLLDEEIARLPEIFRSVFILSCMENLSRSEIAQRLRLKERTVQKRLAEARQRLRKRLSHRGVELAAILAEFQLKLDPNGTVTAVAGRRVDAADAKEHRFPPENEALVAWRIRNMLMGTASKAVVSSAACGADILALESAGGLGLERRVVLPFDRARFRSTSVTDRGPEWGARFDQILGQLDSKDIIELNLEGDENAAYAAANVRIIEEARKLASDTDRFPLAAIVWNGFTRGKGDLTDAFRQLAAERKMGVISIPTL